jgi:hypothetical protein
MMLEKLIRVNDRPVYSIEDEHFKTYGRVLKGYDFSELIQYMEAHTEIPKEGNVYFPSIMEMEEMDIYKEIRDNLYGGMDIQIGYCNGVNSTMNGFEYHRGCEVNIAVTDQAFFLGHTWDLEGNCYKQEKAEIFFAKKGQAMVMHETTLHLSPCKVEDTGFKTIVILLRGTNTTLEKTVRKREEGDTLLLMKNKWILSHKDREPLMKRGAFPGLLGVNTELKY